MAIYKVPKLKPDQCITNKWYSATNKHIHQDWEFTTINEGDAENIINDVSYKSTPDTFILLGPKHTHMQLASGVICRTDICISAENFIKYCEELKPGLYEEINSLNVPIQIHLPSNSYKEIIERLSVVEAYKTMNPDNETPILHSIASYLLGIYIEKSQLKNAPTLPQWFSDFIKKIQEPIYFTKKIEDLVKISNYSHAHFLLIFKQLTGSTLISYITAQRMNYAAKLLLDTDMPVIQIANEAGYENHSFFTQKFRQYFGVNPLSYRKQHSELTNYPNSSL